MKKNQSMQNDVKAPKRAGTWLAAALPVVFLMVFLGSAHAQSAFFWNPAGSTQNPSGPSDGSGNWDDQTVSNWWNGTSIAAWTNLPALQNGAGNGTNAVLGAGVPGIYYITNINNVQTSTLIFSNKPTATTYTAYTISGSQLGACQTANSVDVLMSQSYTSNTITTGGVGVYMNQGNDITNAPNSVLTLASGMKEYGGNPRFEGINPNNSTVNLTGGTVADSTTVTFQVTGVTMNITNAIFNISSRLDVSRNIYGNQNAIINVYNGGQLNVNTSEGNNSGNHLQLTRTGGQSTLNVYPGGYVTTLADGAGGNSTTSGNIRLVPDSSGQATLNVLGGTVLVGDGYNFFGGAGSWNNNLTDITFWDSTPGLNANSRAILTMTGGSITANAIAITAPASAATTSPTNGISITGGTLYLGAPNISKTAGTGTNSFFNLSGGTVAAIQNWSPACNLPINLTNINGNITFQTADSGNNSYNLAFSGPLTGNGGFSLTGGGVLTLSGANSYSGASVISNGTLAVQTPNAPASGSVTLEGYGLATGLPTNSIQPQGGGKSWTINGNLTYDTGLPTADFNFGTFVPGANVPAIQVNGGVAFNVTPQVTVEGTNLPAGSYPLINYTGALSGTPPSTVALTTVAHDGLSGYAGHLANNAGSLALVITASPIPTPLVWSTGSGTWNTAALDWTANNATVAYSDPDGVTFMIPPAELFRSQSRLPAA